MGCGSSAVTTKRNRKYITKQNQSIITIEQSADMKKDLSKISSNEVETQNVFSPTLTSSKVSGSHLRSCTNYTMKIEEFESSASSTSSNHSMKIHTKFTNIESDYLIGKKLGAGNLGEVKVGINKKSQKKVAIKVISKLNLKNKGFSKKAIKQEIKMLRLLDHPNLIKLIDLYEDNEKFYIITEFYNGPTLKDLIDEKDFTEQEIGLIMKQIFSAMNYCHKDLKIIHQDLKTENIMFANKDDLKSLKIIDFGFAKSLEKNDVQELVGTPYYFCPQHLQKNKIFNDKCDIWSLGVVMYQLVAKSKPFDGDNFQELFDAIAFERPKFEQNLWGKYTQNLQNFIKQLLIKDHVKRISAEEALNSEWMKISNPLLNNFF